MNEVFVLGFCVCLHSALVSPQKRVAVWTFMFHLVQVVNAAWDTGTTPKSKETQDSADYPGHWAWL